MLTHALQDHSRNTSLECDTPPAVFTECSSFGLLFVLLYATQSTNSEEWFYSYAEIQNFLDDWIVLKQPYFFHCAISLLPERCSFLLGYNLNKSFFNFNKKQVYFIYLKKSGVMFIHLISSITVYKKYKWTKISFECTL